MLGLCEWIKFQVIDARQDDKSYRAASGVGNDVARFRFILFVRRDIDEIRKWNLEPTGVGNDGEWFKVPWLQVFG